MKRKLFYIILFTIAFAYIEASVVVYLRAIYYPEGFHFPIKRFYDYILYIELGRELSTIVLMASLSILLSKKFWEGFGYFIFIFGIWDIMFYLWLKILVNWPASVFDWDILFLLPLPWIGPVIAPVIISATMIGIGYGIIKLFDKGNEVKPGLIQWLLVLAGTAVILYSFMNDTDAGFNAKFPKPYHYEMLVIGEILYIAAFWNLYRRRK